MRAQIFPRSGYKSPTVNAWPTIAACAVLLAGCFLQSPTTPITATISSGTQFAVTGNEQSLYFDMQGILWHLPSAGGKATALTTTADDIRLPQLSPDGRWLVFQSFATGAWDIVIMRTDSSGWRNLTQSPHDDREPAWSADGKHILFASDRAGNEDIWSVNVATSALTQLTTDQADDYAPAPADTGFLFISDRSGKIALYKQAHDSSVAQIALAPAGKLHTARVSPDGNKVAWVQASQRNGFPGVAVNELVVHATNSGTTKTRSITGSDVFSMPPTWLDSDTLLFTADGEIQRMDFRADGTAQLATVPFTALLSLDSSPYVQSTPLAFSQAEQQMLGIVDPVVLPDDSIVFTGLGDLWLQHPAGKLIQLTNDVWVERDASASPDGRQLAYISDRDGSMQIWLKDLASGDTQRLTDRSSGPRYPTFSPDGNQLAYQQVGPIGTQDFTVRVLDLATGKSKRLRSAPKIWPGRMSWSADGQHLTVAALTMSSGRATDGSNQLLRINIKNDTSDLQRLPDNLVPDFGPVASHDGRQLALIIDGALWRARVTDAGRISGKPIKVLDELVESPAWHADGLRISALTNNGLETIQLDSGSRTNRNPEKSWRPASGVGQRIVHAGRLFTGSGAGYEEHVDILIDGARIISVQKHADHPDNIPVTDASGQTVLPGLIDHHVHFEPHKGEWVGRSLLAFGVTTVVEPGGLPYESREHLEAWSSGARSGPRLIFAGPQLDGARRTFYFASHINSERRLKQELERGERLGYGLIKTYRRLPPRLQRKTVQFAHSQGLPVTAHAALRNLAAGGDRTEHLRGSSRMTYSTKQSALLKSYTDITTIYRATGASVTPTLVNQGAFFDFALKNNLLQTNPQYQSLYTSAYRKNLEGFTRVVSKNIGLIREGLGNAQETVRQLHENGVNVVAGTDSPIFPYGLGLIIELHTYVDAGLTPAEAIQAATVNAAKALGAEDDIGRIAPGMLADLIIVDGDPLANITDLMNVRVVMQNGRIPDTLRAPESPSRQ